MTDEKKTDEPQASKPETTKKSCGCFRKIALTIIIILLVASLTFEFFGNKAIKAGVETAGTKVLKVDVTLDKIDLSPFAGSLEINDLVVANPEGYELPTLLELGTADIKLKTSSLLSDTIEVKYIKLDGMNFTLEQKGLTNNLKTILESLPKSDGSKEDKPAEKSDSKPGKKLHIGLLEISNVKVNAKLIPLPGKTGTLTLPLPTIKMEDIGGKDKEPVDIEKLITKIIDAISVAIAEHGAGVLPEDITGSISEVLGNLPDLEDVAGEALKGAEGLLEGTKDVGKELEEGLKGLFQKKK